MKITFVQLLEQIQFEPQIALLSSVARAAGWDVSRLATDFGTRQEAFAQALQAEGCDLMAVRVTAELKEAVRWSLSELRRSAPNLPVLLFGPMAELAPARWPEVTDEAMVLGDEPEQALYGLLSGGIPNDLASFAPPPGVGCIHGEKLTWGDALSPVDLSLAPPPDYALFGAPAFFQHGTGSSFFGEPWTALLEVGMGSPSGMPGNAGLRGFNYPTIRAPRSRPAASFLTLIDDLPEEVRRVELADREFSWLPERDILLEGLQARGDRRRFSLRFLANTTEPEDLKPLKDHGIERVIFEYDVACAEALERLPEGQDPDRLGDLIDLSHELGLEVGLLVSAGLPGESKDEIGLKLAFIRRHGVDILRFVPFEPGWGHPWRRLCEEKKLLPTGDAAWNREVYTPLQQDCMPPEAWHYAWQECLDVQAHAFLSSQESP